MKKTIVLFAFLLAGLGAFAQTNPAITTFIQNTTGLKGRHYVNGNSTPIQDNVLANVQSVQYSNDWVYVDATGIPAYITGPFLDGNPSLATEQTGFFRLPLNPVQNTGTPTTTTGGNIGLFINGVALFDYRDGVAWNSNTGALCGGPGNPPCPGGMGTVQAWNRDAIRAERAGFDCAKAHPAMGNYHHHQNPSAFNLDQVVISNICDLYPSDGLYVIQETQHSPLVGFAYDGFPIYGAYGFKNTDGTGGITRMQSGYHLRNITERTTHADGTDVADGPPVSTTYPLGYFREDYEYIASPDPDVLDEHNGRFCVTPEYPNGIYCYFATVDENWNSAYPYAVGPTFYGIRTASKVQNINEAVQTYTPSVSAAGTRLEKLDCSVFPNPAGEFIAVQVGDLLRKNAELRLFDLTGKLLQTTEIQAGSTIGYFDVRTLYAGVYLVTVHVGGQEVFSTKVVVE
ncbi:MAG: YHYH protein [Saprospiraceae bacterium]|nr:YHYH protein [Saprospiraceae bacterium]